MRTLTTAALGVVLVGLLTPRAVSAQVINGCIKANGTLKVISVPGNCGNNETPISWNVQGPKGDMGDPGMDGEPGPAGPSLRALDGADTVLGLHASGLAGTGGTFLIEELGLLVPYELAP